MPGLADSAYVNVETVNNLIRALANDTIFSQAGEVLTDNAPFMFPLLNEALGELQDRLNNHGVNTFTKETILTPVTQITVVDPGVQVNISDTGYFDGTTNHAQPTVPSDCLAPLFLWERQTGSTEDWIEMIERLDGLPSVVQSSRLRIWEWRSDQINMPGATQSNDVRMRYTGAQTNFVTTNDVLYIRNGAGAVAYLMLAMYFATKNPEASVAAGAQADRRIAQIVSRSSRAKQRAPVTRKSYGSPRNGWDFIPPRNS